jgi:hypothetical protein
MPDESLSEPGRDRDDGHRSEIDHLFLEAGGDPEPQVVPVDTALYDVALRRDLLVERPASGAVDQHDADWSLRLGMMFVMP